MKVLFLILPLSSMLAVAQARLAHIADSSSQRRSLTCNSNTDLINKAVAATLSTMTPLIQKAIPDPRKLTL